MITFPDAQNDNIRSGTLVGPKNAPLLFFSLPFSYVLLACSVSNGRPVRKLRLRRGAAVCRETRLPFLVIG
jgi:hypothetical protein